MDVHAKDLLNDLKWHRQALDRAWVHYVHRSGPADAKRAGRRRGPQGASSAGDEAVVHGKDIVELGTSFFTLARPGTGTHGSASIPYHRILRVELDGEVIWERRERGVGAGR